MERYPARLMFISLISIPGTFADTVAQQMNNVLHDLGSTAL